jgi:tetratricopeptide (TPR) repeat protein
MQDMFQTALAAHKARDWRKAVTLWEQFRTRRPQRVEGFTYGAQSMLALAQNTQAEALVRAALETFPGEPELLAVSAKSAQALKDWPLAANRWARLRVVCADDVRGYIGGAEALRMMRRFGSAWDILIEAEKLFPGHAEVLLGLARVAPKNQARARWDLAAKNLPNQPSAHADYVRFLMGDAPHEEAARALRRALELFPDSQGMGILRARLAMATGAPAEALGYWRALEERFPASYDVEAGLAEALALTGAFAEAETILDRARARAGTTASIARVHAEIATHKGDFEEAAKRWSDAVARFPQDRRIASGYTSARLRLLMEQDEEAPFETGLRALPDQAGQSEDARLQKIFADFESLGDTCEFAILQREFGLEPLGLLRWTAISLQNLIGGLDADFAGVGDPQQTILEVSPKGEYRTRDSRFGLEMHTFINANTVSREQLFPKLCKRLGFLRRKLLEDLAESRRIFLYKSQTLCQDKDALALLRALRRHGDNRLLVVQEANDQYSPHTLRTLEPRCLMGYIESFRVSHPFIPGWQSLCEPAHALLIAPHMPLT